MAIGNILWPFGIFCGNLVFFGVLDKEKSGNPRYIVSKVGGGDELLFFLFSLSVASDPE
jgi:hypothetical protein